MPQGTRRPIAEGTSLEGRHPSRSSVCNFQAVRRGCPDVDDRRLWWKKFGGRPIDVQAAHLVAHLERSGADLHRGGHRRGRAAAAGVIVYRQRKLVRRDASIS